MPAVPAPTVALSPSFTLPAREITKAIQRARAAPPDEIAWQAMVSSIRDGRLDDRQPGGGPDDLLPTWLILNQIGEEAVLAARYKLTPELSETIFDDAHHLGELMGTAALAGTPWGDREEYEAHEALEALISRSAPSLPNPASALRVKDLILRRPIVRRGRERRVACNGRSRRSRRNSTASSRGSPDDDSGDEPGDIADPPREGRMTPAWRWS
jgi:hypothetical protein